MAKFKLPNKFSAASLIPNPELVAFGAFYQVQEDNGIGLYYMKDNAPADIKWWSDQLESTWEPIYNELLAEFKTKDKTIQFIKEQLEYYIGEYWWKVCPEFKGKQPLDGRQISIEYDKELVGTVSLIMGNIHILSKLKAIPNDDNNGMLYNYMKSNEFKNLSKAL